MVTLLTGNNIKGQHLHQKVLVVLEGKKLSLGNLVIFPTDFILLPKWNFGDQNHHGWETWWFFQPILIHYRSETLGAKIITVGKLGDFSNRFYFTSKVKLWGPKSSRLGNLVIFPTNFISLPKWNFGDQNHHGWETWWFFQPILFH